MTPSLPLVGQPPPAARTSLAVLGKGFRPFFLLAAFFAVAMLPLWLLALTGLFEPAAYFGPVVWHAHELVFGFAVAVIAGFLLTAVGNWTQRETAIGLPLLGLALLWGAGRIVVSTAPHLPRGVPAVVDLAFLPTLAVVIGRPLLATKNRRNFVMIGVLLALFLLDLAIHLDALGLAPGWQRRGALGGVDVVILVIVVVAGRVVPMFTRNATQSQTVRSHPRLDVAAALSVGALTVLELLDPALVPAKLVGGAALVAAALVFARAFHWGFRVALRVPLLFVLHFGHAWIVVGFLLRGLGAFVTWIPAPIATHALTVGAIGAMTLGMMARVALGHSGRALVVGRAVTLAFVLVTLAAVARVFGPLLSLSAVRPAMYVSGVAFTLGFAIYLVVYTPILLRRRIDGKAG